MDNAAWTAPVTFLEFLRDVGKYFSVNTMIAKDSVRSRLDRAREDGEGGISYTEFSYMLLQAHDFYHLRTAAACELQVGATDQWGNITAGTDLIRKKSGGSLTAWGLVFPLLTKSDGTKYGKSASGAVWLDPRRTSPYRFYQYWINTEDADVIKYLKMFTFVPLGQIAEIAEEHARESARRVAQKRLATEVTTWLHGADALRRAERASEVMFGGTLDGLRDADLAPLLADLPSSELPRAELDAGVPLVDLLVQVKLSDSKGAARRLLAQGGVYVNNVRIADPNRSLGAADLATESMLVLRSGKKSYHLLKVV